MNKKKNRITLTVLACLLLAFSACTMTGEASSLSGLLEEQGNVEESGVGSLEGEADAAELEQAETAFVYICGEVLFPGVYEVEADSRICDVLLLAGGFTGDAKEDSVNLAAEVFDGMQVVVPSCADAEAEREMQERERDGMLNINTASASQLCSLPGIGESRAAAIVAYREEHGKFQSPEELMQVDGIKEGMYEKLKDKIYAE